MAQGPSARAVSMSQVKSFLGSPATTSNYQIYFLPPPDVVSHLRSEYGLTFQASQELLYLSCMNTVLPGSSFMTHDITNDRSGVTEKHVYRREYDGDLELTFIIDRDYTPLRVFEGWMGYIGGESVFDKTESNSSYRVPFPKSYRTDNLQVVKFEKDNGRNIGGRGTPGAPATDVGPALQYTFLNAFPIGLNSVPVSYNGSEMLSVTVRMSYSRYYQEMIRADSSGALPLTNADSNNGYGSFADPNSLLSRAAEIVAPDDGLADYARSLL
tara:strand:+ start:1715 stop:2524 length:810 start_codon:yes stop_codon:yes gene_type:complete